MVEKLAACAERDHALEIRLAQAGPGTRHSGGASEADHAHEQDGATVRRTGRETRSHVDTGCHESRRMQERRHRCGTLHGVTEPDAGGAQPDEHRLLRTARGVETAPPPADQHVRADADALPAHQEDQQVAAHEQHQHEEHEHAQGPEEHGQPRLVLHVSSAVEHEAAVLPPRRPERSPQTAATDGGLPPHGPTPAKGHEVRETYAGDDPTQDAAPAATGGRRLRMQARRRSCCHRRSNAGEEDTIILPPQVQRHTCWNSLPNFAMIVYLL